MRIFLFRGLFGFLFSTGMDDLANLLSAHGHKASVHRWTERPGVLKKALNENNSSGFVLIGHSMGANAASRLAGQLHQNGRKIAYLATLDPTNPAPVPAEIVADNFRSSFVLGRNMVNSQNYSLPQLTHIQLDNASQVHEFIAAKIGRVSTGSKIANAIND